MLNAPAVLNKSFFYTTRKVVVHDGWKGMTGILFLQKELVSSVTN